MRKEDFFEVLGELDDDIIKGVKPPVKRRADRRGWRTAMIAAALAAALLVSAAAYAVETVRYNAAVGYLQSLGIDVVDLSDYSRREIIQAAEQAAETYDAGADSFPADYLPENPRQDWPEEPAAVTSDQVRQLTPTMTLHDVVEVLGSTVDVGSGICILVYEVDGQYTVSIPFAGLDAQLGVYGEDLLKALQPME